MSITSRACSRVTARRLARIEFVRGEAAKAAFGVADVGDGKLQKAGAAMRQNFAGEPPESFPRREDRGAEPCWSARLFSNRDIFLSNGGVGRHYDFYRAQEIALQEKE